jgi:hypothetical protein
MLRWLVAILFLANLLAFALASGLLGALPASGEREPSHLNRQIHPDWLNARPLSAADLAEQPPVVGGPAPVAPVQASSLAQ